MTLIVSEVSRLGIAMAADSAETSGHNCRWNLTHPQPAVRTGAEKIAAIESCRTAIAGWGVAHLGKDQMPTDLFLQDFACDVPRGLGLAKIGERLADRVNKLGGPRACGDGGFHVAGYAHDDGCSYPAIYHVYPDSAGVMQLHFDWPNKHWDGYENSRPEGWRQALDKGSIGWLFNGSIKTYKRLSKEIYRIYEDVKTRPATGHPPSSLSELGVRGRLLRLIVANVCDLYALAGQHPTISKPVSWLTISEKGIQDLHPAKEWLLH